MVGGCGDDDPAPHQKCVGGGVPGEDLLFGTAHPGAVGLPAIQDGRLTFVANGLPGLKQLGEFREDGGGLPPILGRDDVRCPMGSIANGGQAPRIECLTMLGNDPLQCEAKCPGIALPEFGEACLLQGVQCDGEVANRVPVACLGRQGLDGGQDGTEVGGGEAFRTDGMGIRLPGGSTVFGVSPGIIRRWLAGFHRYGDFGQRAVIVWDLGDVHQTWRDHIHRNGIRLGVSGFHQAGGDRGRDVANCRRRIW